MKKEDPLQGLLDAAQRSANRASGAVPWAPAPALDYRFVAYYLTLPQDKEAYEAAVTLVLQGKATMRYEDRNFYEGRTYVALGLLVRNSNR